MQKLYLILSLALSGFISKIESKLEYNKKINDKIVVKHKSCEIGFKTHQLLIKDGLPLRAILAYESAIDGKECDSDNHVIVDFTKSIKTERLYAFSIDQKDPGLKFKAKVAHGKKSGGDNPTSFSNKVNSRKSSLGLYSIERRERRTIGPYSFVVKGLDKDTNSNAFRRLITIHESKYMNLGRPVRSSGCFAVTIKTLKKLKENKVVGGYLFVYYAK